MSQSQSGKPHPWNKGSKSHLWKGGITPIHLQIRSSLAYSRWRKSVFERDNYTCCFCGAKNGNGKHITLQADHILPFSKYPALRLDLKNGRTLCKNVIQEQKHTEKTMRGY